MTDLLYAYLILNPATHMSMYIMRNLLTNYHVHMYMPYLPYLTYPLLTLCVCFNLSYLCGYAKISTLRKYANVNPILSYRMTKDHETFTKLILNL